MKVAVPLAKNILASLTTITSTSAVVGAMHGRNMHGRGVEKWGNGIILSLFEQTVG